MKIELSAHEARVIGCLIEKQITTPDQYPLSLNALANACNQKSNRDPLMSLDEQTVQQVVDGLVRKHMVIEKSGFGSRVPKFQHIFCNTEFGSLKFTPLETAIVCELLLRGPQTPGELRTRAQRMAPVGEVSEVEAALRTLAQRPEGPIVVQLPREAGRRDSRYAHLFSGDIDLAALAEAQSQSQSPIATPSGSATGGNAPEAARGSLERLERLEKSVQELRAELDALKVQLGEKRA